MFDITNAEAKSKSTSQAQDGTGGQQPTEYRGIEKFPSHEQTMPGYTKGRGLSDCLNRSRRYVVAD